MQEHSNIPNSLPDLPEDDPGKPTLLVSIDFNHLRVLNNSAAAIKKDINQTEEYVDCFLRNGQKLSTFYKLVKKRYPSLRYFIIIMDKAVQSKTKLALMEFYCRYDNEINLLMVDSRDKFDDLNDLDSVREVSAYNGDFKMNEIYKSMVVQNLVRMPYRSLDIKKTSSVPCRRPLECDPVPKL